MHHSLVSRVHLDDDISSGGSIFFFCPETRIGFGLVYTGYWAVDPGLDYPRTLVTATPDLDGDFIGTPELTCTDPLDCAPPALFSTA